MSPVSIHTEVREGRVSKMIQGVWGENTRTFVYVLLLTDKKEIKPYEYLICFDSSPCINLYINKQTLGIHVHFFTMNFSI